PFAEPAKVEKHQRQDQSHQKQDRQRPHPGMLLATALGYAHTHGDHHEQNHQNQRDTRSAIYHAGQTQDEKQQHQAAAPQQHSHQTLAAIGIFVFNLDTMFGLDEVLDEILPGLRLCTDRHKEADKSDDQTDSQTIQKEGRAEPVQLEGVLLQHEVGNRAEYQHGQNPGHQGVAERMTEIDIGSLRGTHYTFSTAGRSNRPLGLKISTSTSTLKENTSL